MVARERKLVTDFLIRNSGTERDEALIDIYYKKLDVGDYRDGNPEYARWLRTIPDHLMDECKNTALRIAKGSGRKPIEKIVMARIESAFVYRDVYPWVLKNPNCNGLVLQIIPK